MKLDAGGCRSVAAVARAMSGWEPSEPGDFAGIDGAAGAEQIDAFRAICAEMLGNWELARRILPLAEAREKSQEEIEAEEAALERWAKRCRLGRRKASVVHLVPQPDGEDDPSGG